jgi:DNA-binding CsgD family transcriptional regulator
MAINLTSTEKEELEFYRSFHKKMNAAMYLLNQQPYKVDWISDNDCVKRVTGLTPNEVMEKGEYIHSWLMRSPDFEESVIIPIQKFIENPDIKWAGVYRIKNEEGKLSWVMYSATTLERTPEGLPSKVTVVAFPLDDIFNTPGTLTEFQQYLSQKIYSDVLESLTDRQLEVLKHIGLGKRRKDIAAALDISHYTVDDHKNALLKKLDCTSLVELARMADRMGLV